MPFPLLCYQPCVSLALDLGSWLLFIMGATTLCWKIVMVPDGPHGLNNVVCMGYVVFFSYKFLSEILYINSLYKWGWGGGFTV